MGKSRFLLLVGCDPLAQPIQGRSGRIASDEAGMGYRSNLKWFVVRNDQRVLDVMSNETWSESGLASGDVRMLETGSQTSLRFHKLHSKGGSPNMRWSRYVNTEEALESTVETQWWPMNRTLPALVHHEPAGFAKNLLSRGSRFWLKGESRPDRARRQSLRIAQ
jgi:hypothetical protein